MDILHRGTEPRAAPGGSEGGRGRNVRALFVSAPDSALPLDISIRKRDNVMLTGLRFAIGRSGCGCEPEIFENSVM